MSVSWCETWPWAGQKTEGRQRRGRQQGRCCVQRWSPWLLQGEVVEGERASAGWREGADERMTVTGRPWWRRGLCPSLCWCFSGVGGLCVSAHAHARAVDWARREVLCACSGGNGNGWPRGRDWEWQRSCGSGPGPPGGLRQQQQQQRQRQGQGQGQARRHRGGSGWAGRWWRWRLLWTGCEMEMKGLLDGRRRGGWGRVEAVVDQGEERWSRAKLLLSFGGVKGSRTRTGWAAGDGETWRLTGESAEQLYRDLSWNSVVLSCTVMGRAA